MLGIGEIAKAKAAWDQFTANHPKFPAFLNAVKVKGVQEGSVIEIKITGPEGESLETNVKITESDLALMQMFK